MKLKRLAACSALVLFFVGVLVVPPLHALHGCDGDGHGETDSHGTCAICQVSSTPLLTYQSHPTVAFVQQAVQAAATLDAVGTGLFISQNQLARAPPLPA